MNFSERVSALFGTSIEKVTLFFFGVALFVILHGLHIEYNFYRHGDFDLNYQLIFGENMSFGNPKGFEVKKFRTYHPTKDGYYIYLQKSLYGIGKPREIMGFYEKEAKKRGWELYKKDTSFYDPDRPKWPDRIVLRFQKKPLRLHIHIMPNHFPGNKAGQIDLTLRFTLMAWDYEE